MRIKISWQILNFNVLFWIVKWLRWNYERK
jgi:hypothetical protein